MASDRDERIQKARPQLNLPQAETDTSEIQKFQDEVLRPVLKLQNDFLIYLAKKCLLVLHPGWEAYAEEKKVGLLSAWSSRDLEIKKQIEGSIIGLMTQSELDFYFENEREIQRRIRAFVLERIRKGL